MTSLTQKLSKERFHDVLGIGYEIRCHRARPARYWLHVRSNGTQTFAPSPAVAGAKTFNLTPGSIARPDTSRSWMKPAAKAVRSCT